MFKSGRDPIYISYNFAVKPLQEKIVFTETRIDKARMKLRKYKRTIRNARKVSTDYNYYRDTFKQTGKDEQVMSSILSEIEEVARKLDLRISDLKPKRVKKEDLYNRFSVSLTINSEFPDIIKFLYTLQRQPHLFNVEELRFDKQTRRRAATIKTRLVLGKILIP